MSGTNVANQGARRDSRPEKDDKEPRKAASVERRHGHTVITKEVTTNWRQGRGEKKLRMNTSEQEIESEKLKLPHHQK
jgi:hypothetical protein